MEGFVNEKVYDIDTKEKLLDIIQSKEARENFLEFIYDHHAEQEKWQQFYQERSRIRIIEWLRLNHFHFVFEEDLDFPRQILEKLKQSLFQVKVGKEIQNARKNLVARAKTYYSNEALNPRPKRGRPPKQAAKPDIEPQITIDIYTTVPPAVRPFLFTPEISTTSPFSIFSSKFDTDEDLLSRKQHISDTEASLSQKLASLRSLSNKWLETTPPAKESTPYPMDNSFDDDEIDDEDEDENFVDFPKDKGKKKNSKSKPKTNNSSKSPSSKAKPNSLKKAKSEKPKAKRIMPNIKKEKNSNKAKHLKKLLPKKK